MKKSLLFLLLAIPFAATACVSSANPRPTCTGNCNATSKTDYLPGRGLIGVYLPPEK